VTLSNYVAIVWHQILYDIYKQMFYDTIPLMCLCSSLHYYNISNICSCDTIPLMCLCLSLHYYSISNICSCDTIPLRSSYVTFTFIAYTLCLFTLHSGYTSCESWLYHYIILHQSASLAESISCLLTLLFYWILPVILIQISTSVHM
jgi:sensor histidine kinase YesM